MIMKLTEDQFKFLSSTCGAIFYSLITYNQTTISDYQVKYLNGFFKVKDENYVLTRTAGNSIRIENDRVAINYVDSDFMETRGIIVEFKE